MKTTLLNILSVLWLIGAGIQEMGLIELIPDGNDWLKFGTVAVLVILNAIKLQLEKTAKEKAEAKLAIANHDLNQKTELINTLTK